MAVVGFAVSWMSWMTLQIVEVSSLDKRLELIYDDVQTLEDDNRSQISRTELERRLGEIRQRVTALERLYRGTF